MRKVCVCVCLHLYMHIPYTHPISSSEVTQRRKRSSHKGKEVDTGSDNLLLQSAELISLMNIIFF